MAFDDEMPGTQVDAALWAFAATGGLRRRITDAGRGEQTEVVVMSELLTLEDLVSPPLSVVRKGALVLANRQPEKVLRHRGTSTDRVIRRCAAFVRFVVGQRTCGASPEPAPAILLPDVDDAVRRALFDRLGVCAQVRSALHLDFFDGVFDGMWRYQEVRLTQLCAQTRIGMSAMLVPEGDQAQPRVRLLLDCSGRGRDGAYRLCGRPGCTPAETAVRVRRHLEATGVRNITVGSRPDPRGPSAKGRTDSRGPVGIALPI
jgi:hypothetical protein